MTKETAMKILKELHGKSLFAERTALETLIPELKESEDERIRKALIEMVHDTTGDELWVDYNVHKEEALAWLEKQGQTFTKKDVDDAYLKGICDAKDELEKQGTPAKLSEEEQNSFAKGVLSNCALSFINYLDAHSYEGKMCVSNGECEDIENAFHNAMWDRLHRYYCKYIEKQGEQKPIMNVPTREVILSIWDLGNEWKELTNGSISTEYGTQLDYIQKHWYESEYYLREKQGEQKPILDFKASNFYVSKVDGKIHDMTYNPTDKIEPKFKVGDYIVSDYCMGRVIEITNDAYLLDTGQGIPLLISCNGNVHLWTIQDAKDGDVLVGDYDNCKKPWIGIFKCLSDIRKETQFDSHCFISSGKHTFVTPDSELFYNRCKGHTSRCTKPATKEQRDLLFQKMKEAGYEWADDKKELKKVEQKLADKNATTKQDGWLKIPFGAKDSELQEATYYIPKGFHAEIDDDKVIIKKGEKPTAWSEEDEEMAEDLIKGCVSAEKAHYFLHTPKVVADWLKSIKERIKGKED